MIEIALALFKKLAPLIAAVLCLAGIWMHGFSYATKKHIEREAETNAKSALILKTEQEKNADIEKTLVEAARVIDETSQQNQQKNNQATADNSAALADRLRRDSARSRCRPMPGDTAAAESGDGGIAAAWLVPESIAHRLVERHAVAEQVTEITRACQAYVKQIEAINHASRND